MLWVNPHAWIYVDVKKADGAVEEWMIETGTPNTLLRRGLPKEALKAGTQITVDGYQSKDGSLRANGRDLTLPNGQTLFLGSSGTGAPDEDKDKAESKKQQLQTWPSDVSCAGAIRSSTNVFQSWQWGHCQSNSVLR